MKADRKSVLQLILFTLLGVFLIILLFKSFSEQDKKDIFNSLSEANYLALIFPFILNTLSNLVRAWRWKQLYSSQPVRPSSANAFFGLMVGYLANYGLPRMGEVTRCAILRKYDDVPMETSLGTVVVERIVDLISLIAVIFIVVLWQYQLLFELLISLKASLFASLGDVNYMQLIYVGIFLIVLFIAGFFLLKRSATLYTRFKNIAKGFVDGLLSIKTIKHPWRFIGYTVFMWLLYALTIYFSFSSLKGTSNLGFAAACAVLAFSTFGNILVQAGFAAYPFIVMEVLKQYGTSASVGFALGWIMFGAQLFVVLLIGVISLILLPIINRKRDVAKRIYTSTDS